MKHSDLHGHTEHVAFDVDVAVADEYEEYTLKDPIIQQWLLTPLPKDKLTEGMNQEMERMSEFDVYDLVSASSLSPDEMEGAMGFTWAHRWKGTQIRSRLCVRGLRRTITDIDDTYASTPVLLIVKTLLVHALAMNRSIFTYDNMIAFLHASLDPDADPIYVWAPSKYCPSGTTLWRLKKACYGLRTAPREGQDHFADELRNMGFKRLKSGGNI